MRSSNSYLPILSFFGVFLVVTTLQLGKSRTTLDVIQKQKTTAVQEMPLSDGYQGNQRMPGPRFATGPVLIKPFTPAQQLPFLDPPYTATLDTTSVAR